MQQNNLNRNKSDEKVQFIMPLSRSQKSGSQVQPTRVNSISSVF